MKPRKIVLLPALTLTAVSLIYYYGFRRDGAAKNEMLSSGHIEVTEVDLSFRIPGHVIRLQVDEGDRVKKGDPVASLSRTVLEAKKDRAAAAVKELEARLAGVELAIRIQEEVLDAEVRKAEAAVSAARARYRSLQEGSREEEIKEAAAARERAKTEMENLARDFDRLKRLYAQRSIAESRFDDARTRLEAARAAYEAARERFNLVKAGPRKEAVREGQAHLSGAAAALEAARAATGQVEKMKLDRAALEAQVEQARAVLRLAEDDLRESQIYAPFDGFVTVKNMEEAEFVQAGAPVVTVTRLDRVWVKTYVPETQLGRIRLGQKAEVKTDSFPDKKYMGAVTYISPVAEFTPKNVQTKAERVKLVYRIKVSLDNPNQELKAGMPVDVTLR